MYSSLAAITSMHNGYYMFQILFIVLNNNTNNPPTHHNYHSREQINFYPLKYNGLIWTMVKDFKTTLLHIVTLI